jgi:DNA-directed RNA polymerase subunit beta
MKKDMNYITTLPDFIEMQRLSFSWFICQGLSEELSHFSSILDFSSNIESLIFGQQYKLIKPFYTALDAKKDAKSYVAQLQVLIEIRDKSANIILKRERISIVNLPLMTQAATFIINGCERVVVSQIIRSPGIYFEKNKKQKNRKRNSLIISTNYKKLQQLFPNPSTLYYYLTYKGLSSNKLDSKVRYYIKKVQIISIQRNDLEFLKSKIFPTFFFTRPFPFKKIKTLSFFKKEITNKDLYQEKDLYSQKYEEKDFYTAILVPEYGSWIRFSFQTEKTLDQKHLVYGDYNETITIQIDKISKIPIIHLLKKIGLSDLQIYQNLYHSDFFYFVVLTLKHGNLSKEPILRFYNQISQSLSDTLKIFNTNYYRLGKVGRSKINSRLNLKLSSNCYSITYEDIFAITDYLLTLSISKTLSDDIDHLKNRRVRSVGELLQNLIRIGFQRLERKISSQVYKSDKKVNINLNTQLIIVTFKEFFGASQLSQYMDQTNPLSALTHKRRISSLGPGGFNRDRISFAVRDIHPSHYGRICPIETPEGQNVGLIASLTTCARVNQSGFIETPFWRVINGKVIKTGNPIYLTADLEDFYKIAPSDISVNSNNYLSANSIPVRYKQDFLTVKPFEVDFIFISNVQIVSAAASLIPFFEHDDANRALMGSNMQRQSVPLLLTQRPIVGTGLENQIAVDSGFAVTSMSSGIVSYVSSAKIVVHNNFGKIFKYNLQKYQRSNQETCINQRPLIWLGDKVESGQILADGPAIEGGELSLGQNVLVAYMPWNGYNFEDAILINERLVYEDIFTSIHIQRYEIDITQTNEGLERTTKNIPNLNSNEVQHLDNEGIVCKGTFVRPGDILVGKITPKDDSEQLPEAKLLRAIFGTKAKDVRDTSLRMPNGESGRVIDIEILRRKSTSLNSSVLGLPEKIRIFIAQVRKIQVGDKIAGRHGNKGIISRILPRHDMPFLPDGTPIDIILNPLGVPSRMNVGQLYECLLGLAGQKLNRRFKILPFDEMYGQEISRILISKKLRQASIENNQAWLFNPYSPGKMILSDGRTGKEFENPITVGNGYILKLIHLVDDKIHARATGPYSLVTQQPLGGKAQHGGQRFGEMEVWALEGFGAAYTLQELLTIKSDDMQGRNDTLNAIVKGQTIPKSGIPESFKVLLQELRCIGLDISTYRLGKLNSKTKYDIEVNLMETYNPLAKRFSPNANTTNLSFY